MSEEVATIGGGWGIEHKAADDSLAKMSQSSFLPRIQLVTPNSKYAAMEPGIKMKHYGLIASDDDYKDVGSTVDCMVLSWRQKALDTKAGKSYYDHKSDEFIEIQERADIEQNSGCMYGPEYLIYIPEEDALATFFFGSKSLRYEVRKIHKLYDEGQPVTLTSKTIEPKNGSNPYICATPTPCASPIAPPEADRMTEIKKEIDKFNNPKSSQTDAEPESKEAAPASTRAR